MSVRRLAPFLTLVLLLAARYAQAFFDPPWITPAAPRAGETVSVNIRGGICDSIFFSPGYPQVTRQGNAIHLLEYGHHWDTQDLCIYDIGVLSEPVGVYEPGDYTLTVEMIYDDFLYGPTIMTLGVVPFKVTGTTIAAPVPATGVFGRLAILILISGLAVAVLRNRRGSDVQAIH
jgi:hypothetical protein